MTVRNDATRLRIATRDRRKPRSVVSRQGQVLLDTDFDQQSLHLLDRIETEAADIFGSPGRLVVPAAGGGFAVGGVSVPAGGGIDGSVSAGHGYLDGWLVENAAGFTLGATGAGGQPHPWTTPQPLAAPAIIGLKAVVRLVDPVEDPALADKALGDAQASGRALTDWQVFALAVNAPAPFGCAEAATHADWIALTAPSDGTLTFHKALAATSNDPCSLTESGGYSRLENLLYRVEVHRGIAAAGSPNPAIDGPRYGLNGLQLKFSRRNASVMVRITQVNGRTFKVEPAALDTRNWFVEGGLAEIVSIHDDVSQVGGHGTERLFRVLRTTDDSVELIDRSATNTVASTGANGDGSWFLRLWDVLPGGGEVATVAVSAGKSQMIDLGDGISIQLGGGATSRFRRGDYWTCAMRADGSIEWVDGSFETPHGPKLRYAPLAAIGPGGSPVSDCRITTATLTDRILVYRGGDGQEAKPDPTKPLEPVLLGQKLRVAVVRGAQPVNGAKVTFAIQGSGIGRLIVGASSGQTATVETGTDGLAEIAWEIDPTISVQTVTATLVQPAGTATNAPIVFTANLSLAADVGFDPKNIPIFAGITDVQKALEALSAMQQAGCATYVLTPDNWIEILKALKPGEHAKLCFQRGRFETKDRIVLEGLGDITLCGAGDASRLVVESGETVLELFKCRSVHVEHLAIYAPDGATGGADGKHLTGRNGALTVTETPIVSVHGCTLLCGGQALAERTCLTIRGTGEKPLRSVRVTDNRLEVGFAQDGILVTDALSCVIEGNDITARALKDEKARARALLARPFQRWILRQMVPDGEIDTALAATDNDGRKLVIGAKELRFASSASQAEWDALAKRMPPEQSELDAPDGAQAYLRRLTLAVADQPKMLKSYGKDVERVERASGVTLNREARAALIVRTDAKVSTRPGRETPSATAATDDSAFPQFASVMPRTEWLNALKTVPAPQNGEFKTLADRLRLTARTILSDVKLRKRFPGFNKWYETAIARLDAYARQGITCGGRLLGDVSVARNRIEGFGQAIHVGTSYRDAKEATVARSVTVAANVAYCNTLFDQIYMPAAILVGNADTVRISDNLLAPLAVRQAMGIRHAVRVWGEIGLFLAIEKNRIGVGQVGIRIRSSVHIEGSAIERLMWLVSDNLVEHLSPSDALMIPPFVERRYNKP